MTLISEAGVLWRVWDTVAATNLGKALKRRFVAKRLVLLLGSTGVGKSQFLQSLGEIISPPIPVEARTVSTAAKEVEIGGRIFLFRDIPGQREHAPIRSNEVKAAFRSKRSKTLYINVVSFGYHEYGASRSEVIAEGQVREDFLDNARQREIDLLSEVASVLDDESIITVITKADIWLDRSEEVFKHYKEGKYGQKMKSLFPRANHVVKAYSSINRLFYEVKRDHNFDDNTRVKMRTELLRTMVEIG